MEQKGKKSWSDIISVPVYSLDVKGLKLWII